MHNEEYVYELVEAMNARPGWRFFLATSENHDDRFNAGTGVRPADEAMILAEQPIVDDVYDQEFTEKM